MNRIVGQIGEQSLVNIKKPSILPIDFNALRELQRTLRNYLGVRQVLVAGHVILHESFAPRRDLSPRAGVIGLHGESPAVAVQYVVGAAAAGKYPAVKWRDSDDGLGSGSG